MSKLLYVEASPMKDRSRSTAVAAAFLETYKTQWRTDEISSLDLWRTKLPAFDAETIDAKFAVLRNNTFTEQQWNRWESVRAVSRAFNAADKYVFSLPMWNFGVPYPLKHLIDVVTLPGENWAWSKEQGYRPLLFDKKALLIYTSANDYRANEAKDSDFQKPYMRRWLRFIGISDIHEISIAPTLGEAATVAKAEQLAIQQARTLAEAF